MELKMTAGGGGKMMTEQCQAEQKRFHLDRAIADLGHTMVIAATRDGMGMPVTAGGSVIVTQSMDLIQEHSVALDSTRDGMRNLAGQRPTSSASGLLVRLIGRI